MKARWVKVDRLDNWAIFVSADGRCQALPCMNSEIWGGRSNHMYFPGYQSEQPWAVVQLWQRCSDRLTWLHLVNTGGQYHRLVYLGLSWCVPWLLPVMILPQSRLRLVN
jgi:hypothetical protein